MSCSLEDMIASLKLSSLNAVVEVCREPFRNREPLVYRDDTCLDPDSLAGFPNRREVIQLLIYVRERRLRFDINSHKLIQNP